MTVAGAADAFDAGHFGVGRSGGSGDCCDWRAGGRFELRIIIAYNVSCSVIAPHCYAELPYGDHGGDPHWIGLLQRDATFGVLQWERNSQRKLPFCPARNRNQV